MMTFSINEQNEIVAFASAEQAAAHSATPFDTFTNEEEWASLASTWPGAASGHLEHAAWGYPGAQVHHQNTAIRRIWGRLQSLASRRHPSPPSRPTVAPVWPTTRPYRPRRGRPPPPRARPNASVPPAVRSPANLVPAARRPR